MRQLNFLGFSNAMSSASIKGHPICLLDGTQFSTEGIFAVECVHYETLLLVLKA